MNIALWIAAGVALGGCEAAGRLLDHGWPTTTELVRRARLRVGGRVMLGLGWLWLGWHVFAR